MFLIINNYNNALLNITEFDIKNYLLDASQVLQLL